MQALLRFVIFAFLYNVTVAFLFIAIQTFLYNVIEAYFLAQLKRAPIT